MLRKFPSIASLLTVFFLIMKEDFVYPFFCISLDDPIGFFPSILLKQYINID